MKVISRKHNCYYNNKPSCYNSICNRHSINREDSTPIEDKDIEEAEVIEVDNIIEGEDSLDHRNPQAQIHLDLTYLTTI